MTELVDQMKVVLASTFAFYLKVQNFHWNIEGPNFNQYHDFLGELYTEIWESVDEIAEHIRALDVYVPASLSRYSQLTVIDDQINIPTALKMFSELQLDNQKLKAEITKAYRLAESANELGLSNFLQGRLDIHAKHGWMLRAIGK